MVGNALFGRLRPLDQNVCDFRSREFERGPFARFQEFAHLGAAGGDFLLGAMGAGFAAHDGGANLAPCRVLELEARFSF